MELPSTPPVPPSGTPDGRSFIQGEGKAIATGDRVTSISQALDASAGDANSPGPSSSETLSGSMVDGNIEALTTLRADLARWLSLQNAPGGIAEGGAESSTLPSDLAMTLAQFLSQGKPSSSTQGDSFSEPPLLGKGLSESSLSLANLESLLLKTLATSGGEIKLLMSLRQLPSPVALSVLKGALVAFDGLSETQGESQEQGTRPLLQLMIRSLETTGNSPLRKLGQAENLRPMTGNARIVDREWSGDIAAGLNISRGFQNVSEGSPLLRLQLWSSGRSLPMLAPESPLVGHPVQFTYAEASGLRGTVTSNSLGKDQAIPSQLESAYGLASPAGRLALAAAQDLLSDIEQTPFYAQAVRDFAAVIEATGWMQAPISMDSKPFQPATRPELESLLKLWLETDRDANEMGTAKNGNGNPNLKSSPNQPLQVTMASSWAEAIRNPEVALKALQWLRPQIHAEAGQGSELPQLLSPATLLTPASSEAKSLFESLFGEAQSARLNQGASLEAWSRLNWKEVLASHDGAEARLGHFPGALQVITSNLKAEDLAGQSPSATVYFFQPPQWHALQVEREPASSEKKTNIPRRKGSGWKASVDWTGDFLGNALACVKLVEGGIDLEIRHEGPNAQELLHSEISRLEAALAQMGLDLKSWAYLHQPKVNPSEVQETRKLPNPSQTSQLDLRF